MAFLCSPRTILFFMDEFDVPIFKKAYDLYKLFHDSLKNFPKQERYSLGQKCESVITELLEYIFHAGQARKQDKIPFLERASVALNLLRVYLRLAKDVRALDVKNYVALQLIVDEIGRMIGGWQRSLKNVVQSE